MTTATQAEFSRMKGVSRATVTHWKTTGHIIMVGGLVDVEASQARLLRYCSSNAKGGLAALTVSAPICAG